jgi:hypothetical protein
MRARAIGAPGQMTPVSEIWPHRLARGDALTGPRQPDAEFDRYDAELVGCLK